MEKEPNIRDIRKKLKRTGMPASKSTGGIPAKYKIPKRVDPNNPPKKARVFRKVYEKLMQKGFAAQIPVAIIEADDLKPQEKLLFMLLSGLSYNLGFSYGGNELYAQKLNIGERQVSTLMGSLQEKGYIKVDTYAVRQGKRRFVTINLKKVGEATRAVQQKRKEWEKKSKSKDD